MINGIQRPTFEMALQAVIPVCPRCGRQVAVCESDRHLFEPLELAVVACLPVCGWVGRAPRAMPIPMPVRPDTAQNGALVVAPEGLGRTVAQEPRP